MESALAAVHCGQQCGLKHRRITNACITNQVQAQFAQDAERLIIPDAVLEHEATILDLLFDATDIEQGDFFVRAVEYDAGVSKFFRMIARERSLLRLFDLGGESRIVNWFAKQPV